MQPIKLQRRLWRNSKAVSPAVSTVILTAATVVMILIAMFYANGYLSKRMAENEFNANKQFMITTGLQIDDIAWAVGRTQTIRYSSEYGSMKFQPLALSYSFEVYKDGIWSVVSSNETGMIMFNMPVSMYSMGNNYFQRISVSDNAFIHNGTSAPIIDVYAVENLPMNEGNFTRIVAAPTVRLINTSITSSAGGQPVDYYKFYLPTLCPASSNPYLSKAVTLTGVNIEKVVQSGVNQVRINITFPSAGSGFNLDFFKFGQLSQTVSFPSASVVEFYVGKITVAMGAV